MRKDITIDQIAKFAGVSKATISRYLNGKYQHMSVSTREKIKGVIDDVGYRPNNVARSLKSKKSGLIGCVVSDITNPFSAMLFKGITNVCEQKNYNVLFAHSSQNAIREIRCIESLIDNNIDGLIIHTTSFNYEYLNKLKIEGQKIVLADLEAPSKFQFDSVSTENYKGAYECIEHLYEQGYKNVYFVSDGELIISSHRQRFEGYCDAMKHFYNKNDTSDLCFESCSENYTDLKRQLISFLQPNDVLTSNALFAVNGIVLYRLIDALRELGLNITGRPGICGFDGWGVAHLIGPGITTVRQNAFEVGRKATEILLKRIYNEISDANTINHQLPNFLLKAGSTCPFSM